MTLSVLPCTDRRGIGTSARLHIRICDACNVPDDAYKFYRNLYKGIASSLEKLESKITYRLISEPIIIIQQIFKPVYNNQEWRNVTTMIISISMSK